MDLFDFEVVKLKKVKKRTREKVEGYTEAVAHILGTYLKKKGARYPFNGRCGEIIKRAVACYTLNGTKALWDVFLNKDWSWKHKDGYMVRVACDLVVWEAKWTFIVDMPEWKAKRTEYDRAMPVKTEEAKEVRELIKEFIEEVPRKESFQKLKLKAMEGL